MRKLAIAIGLVATVLTVTAASTPPSTISGTGTLSLERSKNVPEASWRPRPEVIATSIPDPGSSSLPQPGVQLDLRTATRPRSGSCADRVADRRQTRRHDCTRRCTPTRIIRSYECVRREVMSRLGGDAGATWLRVAPRDDRRVLCDESSFRWPSPSSSAASPAPT
jgi:hypothetical protein